MIKIDLIINSENVFSRFFTDEKSNFVMSSSEKQNILISGNAGYEFDGICDEEGNFHFLLQDNEGNLLYIRYDKKVWKKYNLLSSKEKKASISKIILTSHKNMLCAFYIIEHNGRNMLIKHVFNKDNLTITPSVIGLLDFRKDYCVCTHPDSTTHIYYRNEKGKRCECVLDNNFSRVSDVESDSNDNIYVMKVVCNQTSTVTVSICARKNYTALIFKSGNSEKIITFGISKNAHLSVYAYKERISIFWDEGNMIMHSESKNHGKDFSKPSLYTSDGNFKKLRNKGLMVGTYQSEYICTTNHISHFSKPAQKCISNNIDKGVTQQVNSSNNIYKDFDSSEFLRKLSQIEKETEKIGIGIDKICIFLDKLVQFKKDSENPLHSFATPERIGDKDNIGDRNEDNIKLFENMSIEDAIENKDRISTFQVKEPEDEHTV